VDKLNLKKNSFSDSANRSKTMRPIQFAGKDLNFMKIRIGNNIEVLIYKTSKMLIRTQEGCVICYLIYLEAVHNRGKMLNEENLKRVIAVRNILIKRQDKESDYAGLEDVNNLKKEIEDNKLFIFQKKFNLGQPSFIKTKFKVSTISKIK